MRAELVDDLLDVLKFLRGEVGVIEQPVKFLAVLVLGAHELHSAVYKAEHFVALLDALRLMLQLRAGEIRAGQIDGFQKILNRLAIVDPESIPNLTHGNLQTPYDVTVLPQQCPCIVIMRIFGHVCRRQLMVVYFLIYFIEMLLGLSLNFSVRTLIFLLYWSIISIEK